MCTASKVVNGEAAQGRISEECARRVLDVSRALGYRPNPHARFLRKGRVRTLGVLMMRPRMGETYWKDFYADMVSAIDWEARAQGFDFLVFGPAGDTSQIDEVLRYVAEGRVDSVIIPGYLCPDPPPRGLLEVPAPIVLAEYHGSALLPTVKMDDGAGISAAVQHLAALGHRRILWFSVDDASSSFAARRREAFWAATEAVGAHGDEIFFSLTAELPRGDFVRAAYETAGVNLARLEACTAAICYNDCVALGLCARLTTAGWRIPEDMSVIGFDDLFAEIAWPPLTTLTYPLCDIGRQAARLAIDLLEDSQALKRKPAPVVYVPATPVVRKSTAPPGRKMAR